MIFWLCGLISHFDGRSWDGAEESVEEEAISYRELLSGFDVCNGIWRDPINSL